ncbi:MAG: hypothetical protein M1822_006158 [Bathelium mastoideum]|nr:MAG: hypothetical protein M1822_006158 [Bathelium mastoideum]
MAAEKEILKHQIALLEEKVEIQSKRAPQGKPLFEQVRAEGESQTLFVSPSKIARAFELQHQKEADAEAEAAAKQQQAIEQALNREHKQRELQERKDERERKRQERLEKEAQKKAKKEAKKAQQEASKKGKAPAKSTNQKPKNQGKKYQKSKATAEAEIVVDKEDIAQPVTTRTGRKTKPTKHFEQGK